MYQISVSEVLERAWELFKKHGLVLTVILVVISLIGTAVGSLLGTSVDQEALMEAIQNQDWKAVAEMSDPIGNTVQNLLNLLLMVGFYNAMLMLVRGKAGSVAFGMWKLPLMTYVKLIAFDILYSLIVIVGLCLCIIPGIWLAARLQFGQYLLIENAECSIMEAFKQSWEMTKGNSMNLILLGIAQFFIAVIGFILCCIGVFPACVIAYFASVVAYLTLSGFYTEPVVEEVEA